MSKFELKLPRMGESVAEATLTSWLKEVGDTIEMDEAVFEIATDKVDSEVPSEVDGVLVEKLFNIDDIIKVGDIVAVIETNGEANESEEVPLEVEDEPQVSKEVIASVNDTIDVAKATVTTSTEDFGSSDRFYSPLVKNIAKQEGLPIAELDTINGTGKEGRVTKDDILGYLETRQSSGSTLAQDNVGKV
ncbi:MAG: E3 binding domain-containing protein, partial [Maribacter sp.]|nr:E3 binding domain-containing protein [Maribacter sp.]